MTSKAEELIAQLEAEIVKRDARIAELVGVRDHLRLQASIQAQEARTQKAIVAEIGAMVGEPCDWLTASAVREALKAQQPSAGVVLPEPDFYWIPGDESPWNSPEEWAQDYYDNNGEKPESVLLSCAVELPDREYDSFEFDENGNCTSLRLVVRDEGTRLNPCRAQAVQICKLGMYGAAYDAPDTCRAYTYAAQPGNDIAYRLGDCLRAAHCDGGGDFIDFGLALLRRLQDKGFGVFQIAAAPSAKKES